MKKVYLAVCLLVVMTAMVACAPDEDMLVDSATSNAASSEAIESSGSEDIVDGESWNNNDTNQTPANTVQPPKNAEEFFGFNAESLLLGKTFKEIKGACPDLLYTGNFMGAACFYSASKGIWWEFGYTDIFKGNSDIKDPNIPDNENAIGFLVATDAEIIFPDMGTRLSTSDIGSVIGAEVEVMSNDPGTELAGEYIAIFRYNGYHFLYLPEETTGEVFPDTAFHVSEDD